eukprot:TRINITY_DN25336_c0_g1_i1.p1 TRINITY_DN25336_c0_g1~~TRINITY_DN25336_c0_g1_i1.p1  ORF type:complete len:268 (+),score=101.98 TRINITY_DN25336_c0_g1_i1:64-804(+)
MSCERKLGKKAKLPDGWITVAPTLEALDRELKDQIAAGHDGKRVVEMQWPVHQINWQKTRYIYDMYYIYKKIDKAVYDYCIKNKIVDANLIAKWKKPGYERLCSTYVINPNNYNFGGVSICRVPKHDLGPDHPAVEDKFCGCRGCASGRGGKRNIFGNKYGQYLAAIQVSREERAAKGEEVVADNVWASTEDEAKFDTANVDSDDDDEGGNRRKRRRKLQRPADEFQDKDQDDEKAAGTSAEAPAK